MNTLTLEQALYWRREGLCTRAQWLEYAHLWQTSSPRFGTRVCQCEACVKAFPSSGGYVLVG